MSEPRSQAEVQLLEKLLLGQLPVEEADRLAAELADDSRLTGLAQSLGSGNDTLLDSLRQHQTIDDANADQLVERLLKRLKVPAISETATMGFGQASPADGSIPERLEYFRLVKVLGQGGMGTVYLADDTRLGRSVAIKTLKRELAANAAAKDRFLREARSAAKLHHDHIIPIYYVGEADGIPFLAMPFLEGEPLDRRIQRERNPLAIQEGVRIAREVAVGLSVAHKQGLIHRDIKPANIWLEAPAGRAKILDFGLARSQNEGAQLTASGAIIGTPAYMAPEQARGKPVDARADLFSLGCVLYEMLTGERPFRGQDTMAILSSLALDAPDAPISVNSKCPQSLSNLTMQLLAKEPSQRPASAKVVANALAKYEMPSVELINQLEATSAIDPWSNIDDAVNAVPIASAADPEASARANKRRVMPFVAIAIGLALIGLGIIFSGTIIRVANNEGELVVQVDDPNMEVVVKGDGVEIHREENGKKRVFLVKAGKDGEVEVREPGSETVLVMEKFKVTRAGKTEVTVTAEKLATARMNNAPDRKAADWVLSIDGRVRIDAGGERKDVAAAEDLPAGHWKLVSVDLIGNKHVTNGGLAHLKMATNLTELDLTWTQVSDAGLKHLKGSTNLTFLCLASTAVSDAGLEHLKGLTKLRSLDLGLTKHHNALAIDAASTQVSDIGLKHLEALANLTSLDLGGTQVSDVGLVHLKGLTNLRELWLTNTKVTTAGVDGLRKALPNCKIDGALPTGGNDRKTAEWVLSIGGNVRIRVGGKEGNPKSDNELPKEPFELRIVDLVENAKVSDAGLAGIQDCKELTHLFLQATQVGDAGLVHIKTCTNLTLLNLRKTKVTPQGIDDLKKALPNCKIEWDGGVIEPSRYTNSLGMEFALVPKGKAWLGGGGGKEGTREVSFKDDFFIGVYPVTQEEWQKVTGANAAHYSRDGFRKEAVKDISDDDLKRFPVEGVSFADVDAFLAKFNERDKQAGWTYRLPTQDEWEYACRGGPINKANSAFHFYVPQPAHELPTNMANYAYKGGPNRTVKVGQYPPNKLGIHDMHGLVLEWCSDGGKNAIGEDTRIARGGSFNDSPGTASSEKRFLPTVRYASLGLRVVRARTAPGAATTADRRAAEWVLSMGGFVDVRENGKMRKIRAGEKLPEGYFTLTSVDVRGQKVTDDGLAIFEGCKNLTYLIVQSPRVTDVGLANFKDCTLLDYLNLEGTGVTVAGLATFEKNDALTGLVLLHTSIGDESIDRLTAFKRLRGLNVKNTKITDAGLKKLKDKLPQCKIE